MAKKKFCVEFDGRFCFVEAKDLQAAEKIAMEEFGMHRGPFKGREASQSEVDRFREGNGVVLP